MENRTDANPTGSVIPLEELFPDEDYRFHLTLRRGDPRAFFAPADPTGAVVAERARWIAEGGKRYADLLPEGRPLLAGFANLITGNRLVGAGSPAASDPRVLGAALEPDFLLLSRDEAGVLRLRGGALCFPTGWALEEKIGHPLDFIHSTVPGLNATLGRQVDQFFSRLTPANAFMRANWGIAATAELNMHPAVQRPTPAPPLALESLWLRVEHQIFAGLPPVNPESRPGVVFGIRIALHRLDSVARNPAVRTGLARALRTMSPEVAAYKRLDTIRDDIVRSFQISADF